MNIHSLLNVLLLAYLLSFPLLLEVNKRILKGKNPNLNRALRTGRRIHPWTGVILVVSGGLHGYLKLGGAFAFHTGSLLLLILALNGVLGFAYRKTRKRHLAAWHRGIGVLAAAAFVVHYTVPWLFA